MKKINFFVVYFSFLTVLINFTGAYAMEYEEYVVKPRDNFWKISKKMKIDFNKIKEINRDRLRYADNFDLIFPGQVFLIPTGKLVKEKTLTRSIAVEKKIPATEEDVTSLNREKKNLVSEAEANDAFLDREMKNVVPKKKDNFLDRETNKVVTEETAVFLESVARKAAIKKKQYDEEVIDKRETSGKLVIHIVASILTVCLAIFVVVRFYFRRRSRRQHPTVNQAETNKRRSHKHKLFSVSSVLRGHIAETKKISYVGYLTRTGSDKGYYILDSDGNWIINIENIRSLAYVAVDKYNGDVKRNISYKSPDYEIILKLGVMEGGVRTLLPEEIVEFEKIAC